MSSVISQFPGGKAAVCEGEIKSFGAKFIKGKGKKVAVFKKGGCLGTSSIIGLNKSDSESAQGLQWPASLPQVPSACNACGHNGKLLCSSSLSRLLPTLGSPAMQTFQT